MPPLRLACTGIMVRRPFDPPSSFAKYSTWLGAQQEARTTPGLLMPFLCYRPLGFEPPMSVALVDPVLAGIIEAFSGTGQHGAPPNAAELKAVAALTCMADHYGNKGQRRDKFNTVMNGFLGAAGYLSPSVVGSHETDGTILAGGMPIAILAAKNNVGVPYGPYNPACMRPRCAPHASFYVGCTLLWRS